MVVTNVIAHRGASRAERENTLMAFVVAGQMSADAVELDVRTCADGVLVVHHAPTFADGRLIIDTRHADLPDHIPDLRSALLACEGMWVNIEIKNDPNEQDFDESGHRERQTIEVLNEMGQIDRWLISSFRRNTIDFIKQLQPQLRTAWLTIGVAPQEIEQVVKELVDNGHEAIHPYVDLLTRDTLERYWSAGLKVNTWTCDDPARIEELMRWGIDGICTNVPDVAVAIRRRLGQV